jgi:hypothetical protein
MQRTLDRVKTVAAIAGSATVANRALKRGFAELRQFALRATIST